MTMARKKNHNLRKRVNTWYFNAMINGSRIQESLHTVCVRRAREKRDEYLDDIRIHGYIRRSKDSESGKLFGECAQDWAEIAVSEVAKSTMRDYRSAMNFYILPTFDNLPIKEIDYTQIMKFVAGLKCSAKRINNILAPMRSVFSVAEKSNVMKLVENRKTVKPKIYPLSFDEVNAFLEKVNPYFRPFFEVAFFTGMRRGEMSALKWRNVDFVRKVIRVIATRVYGEEKMPKTFGSYRDIDILPMTFKALKEQATRTMSSTRYVFLNGDGEPIDVETLRNNAWSKGLKRVGLEYRPMIQTRHTFATMMISSGENPGWGQKMMGHGSLKMIINNYYKYIPNITHADGSRFMGEYGKKLPELRQNDANPND